MEIVKENEQVRKEEEANNSSVSFSALREDIINVPDFMERLKNEGDQKAVDVDLFEKLKLKLTFICTYVQLSYSDFDQFEDIMTGKRQEVENLLRTILDDVDYTIRCKYNVHHVLPHLADNMDDCIRSHHRSKSDGTMTEEQLNFFLLNLHHLSMYHAEKIFSLVTEYGILQNVCSNIGDFHGLIVNGCIKHEIVENVLPLYQLMAQSVGHFLWEDQIDQDSQLSELDEDDQTDGDSQPSELDEDDQTDGDSQPSEIDEDDQTEGDSQLSELYEDGQTDGDSQLSELYEDGQTDGDSQLSELYEDGQTDGNSQPSEIDEDDQTDGDEDDQTDGDSQLSEPYEDGQIDADSQPSEIDEDDQTDGDSQPSELAHLLMKIIPIELEVMHICYTNLKDSPSAEVGRFIKQILETSPDNLGEYLIHLQEHMVTVITASTSGARNIHIMIEFLLIILTDMPKDFIHPDKLFDLLARVGELIKEVSTLVHGLEEKSRNEESTMKQVV